MALGFLAHGYATHEFEVTEERLGVYLPVSFFSLLHLSFSLILTCIHSQTNTKNKDGAHRQPEGLRRGRGRAQVPPEAPPARRPARARDRSADGHEELHCERCVYFFPLISQLARKCCMLILIFTQNMGRGIPRRHSSAGRLNGASTSAGSTARKATSTTNTRRIGF